MSDDARAEREALADLMLQLGPDAPTIDEGWVARDLAAHVVLRERRPDAAAGIAVAPLAGWTRQVGKQLGRRPWPELVAEVRRPPAWSPFSYGPLHELANAQEFTIHHEDLRRAQPGWEPRSLPRSRQDGLWGALRRGRRLLFRRSPVGVRLHRTGGEELEAASGQPVVVLTGEPLELLLYASGRAGYARVGESGDPAAVAALRRVLHP